MSNVEVLFFAADPLSAAPDGSARKLLLEEEVRQIRRKVRLAPFRKKLHFDTHGAARTSDVLDALIETRPQIVHFSGHGGHDGLVLVAADGHGAQRVPPEGLKALFRMFPGEIRVVVLNACFSLDQARDIAEIVGCAIGTSATIEDPAAIAFAARFYRAIASGKSVQAAFDEGRLALKLENYADAECPQLVCRAGVDPARLVLIPSPAVRFRRRVGATLAALMLSSGAVVVGQEVLDGPEVQTIAGPWMAAPGPGAPSGSASDAPVVRSLKPAAVFEQLKQRADRGDPNAMGQVALAYLNGEGVAPDPASGVRLLRDALKKRRDPVLMKTLAAAYEAGNGVNLSLRWARHWYRAAATEAGDVDAMRNLARLYHDMSSDSTERQALAWYETAAQAGSVEAMVDLGVLYQKGRLAVRDPAAAERWFRKAAAAGSTHARVYLDAARGPVSREAIR